MRILIIALLLLVFGNISLAEEHPTLAIGAKAPVFSLKGVDGKTYSLASFSKYKMIINRMGIFFEKLENFAE